VVDWRRENGEKLYRERFRFMANGNVTKFLFILRHRESIKKAGSSGWLALPPGGTNSAIIMYFDGSHDNKFGEEIVAGGREEEKKSFPPSDCIQFPA
jgi:hypothetical protein